MSAAPSQPVEARGAPASRGVAGPLTDQAPRSGRRRSLGGYLFMPVLLLAILAALYLWVSSKELGSIEQSRINASSILGNLREHMTLTLASTVLVLVIAIPVGVLLTRPFARTITPPAIAVFNIGQAVPSIGVIALFALTIGIGFSPVVIALVAYSMLPVLRNTMVGLEQVDASVIESARGMGMTKTGVLTRIELPLAVPVIMAGLRTALTINVGTAALAALVGAGGLGELIVSGIVQNRQVILVVGAVLVAVLALFVDYVAGIAEDVLRPRGL
ncbi:MAG: ABC transporter permease [Chloroflexota bacterium]|nr:ABC transporter permease [Chloroflexota bacterium]